MVTTYAFLIVIAIVYPLAWGATTSCSNRNRRLYGSAETSTKVIVFIIFLVFVIFCGFRSISGMVNDEYAYRNRVMSMIGKPLMEQLKKGPEVLDTLANWIIANTLHDSQWIIVWDAFVTYGCFIYCIYKQCDNFELGILLLFLLNIVNVSFNTMQQMEAVAVSMIGIPYLHKRKFFKYIAVVAVAALIHNSAVMLIALYFIANMKPWSAKFIGVAAAFVIMMLVFDTVAPGLFSTLGVFEEYSSTYDSGVKTITVIVAFIPIAFALVFRGYMPDDDNELNCAINMTLIYAMIYLVSTQNVYVARFGMYIQPMLIVFFTKFITVMRKSNLSTLLYYVLVFGYGATMVYFTGATRYSFVRLLF